MVEKDVLNGILTSADVVLTCVVLPGAPSCIRDLSRVQKQMGSQLAYGRPDILLMEIVVAARRLLAVQTQLDSLIVPASLADAIERDFLLFDLQEATIELRCAVEVAEAVTMKEITYRNCMGLIPNIVPSHDRECSSATKND